MSRDYALVIQGIILGFLIAAMAFLFVTLLQTLNEPEVTCKPISIAKYHAMIDAYAADHTWQEMQNWNGFDEKYCLTP